MPFEAAATPTDLSAPRQTDIYLRTALLGVALLAWTCLVRLPFLHIVNDDEAFFSVMATRWLHGDIPYADSYDVKPPLLFILFALTQSVFGVSLATIKGLEIVFTAAGALALYRLVERHGTAPVARWSAWLYPVYSLALSGVNAPNTLLQAPFLILAFSLVLDAVVTEKPARPLFLCGLMAGLAGLIKQTALFEALALVGLAVWYFRHHQPVRRILWMAAGMSLPVFVFAAYFAAIGHLPEAFDAVVTQSLTRVNLDLPETRGDPFIGFTRFLPICQSLLFLMVCALMTGLRHRQISDRIGPRLLPVLAVWFAASATGIIALHAMFSYYAATLMAPLLVLSGAFVCHGTHIPGKWRMPALTGFTAAAILFPLLIERNNLRITDFNGPDDVLAEQATADKLKQLGLSDSDRLLVLKRGLFIYVLTESRPDGRYYHNLHLLCPFPTPDATPLADAFARHPKFVVLADPSISRACETPQGQALTQKILTSDFELKAVTAGKWDRFLVYQLRPQTGLNTISQKMTTTAGKASEPSAIHAVFSRQ